jgi:ABC-type transport system involved in cytochrome bd biosynthesis fused ATPase/permease subunit
VEQGTAFCPQCNAPQIRVAVAETVPPSGTISESSIPPLPAYFGASLGTRIEWSQAWPATALAGLIAALLMITPFAGLGLGMLIGGSLSVVFYRRRVPAARVTPGMGARLGMVTGVLGSGLLAIVLAIRTLLFHGWDRVREDLIAGVEQAAARNPDPQTHQVVEFLKSPQGVVLLLSMALITTLVAFVIFSGLGGALGAALLRRRKEHL